MHLLYLDDSGSTSDPASRLLVLAGLSLFERQTHWLERQLDGIAQRFDPANPRSIELHGSPMYGGRGHWRKVARDNRHQAIADALVAVISQRSALLFGVAVDINACVEEPTSLAFEHLCSAFDRMLMQRHLRGDTQRGLILFDKYKSERALQVLARDFKELGHRWGVLRNMADVPVFLDSKASRLIQAADLIAYALKRHFLDGDDRFFNIIQPRFYRPQRGAQAPITLPEGAPMFIPAQTAFDLASTAETLPHSDG